MTARSFRSRRDRVASPTSSPTASTTALPTIWPAWLILPWRLIALLILCIATMAGPAFAQDPPADQVDPAKLLESARKDMEAIRATQDDMLDDAALQALRKRALSAQTRAQEAASALTPELTDVQARLAQLGQPAAGVKESPDVAAQRAQLMRSVSTLDSQIKLARLLAVEAEQAITTASENRRQQLGARLGERAPSVLQPSFWQALAAASTHDLQRAGEFGDGLRALWLAVSPGAWVTLAVAIAALLLVCAGLRRALAHVSVTRVPAGRLRRSLYAMGELSVRTLRPGLAAHALLLTLTSGATPAPPLAAWLDTVEAIVWFGGFVAGLGAALLMPSKPSWRLPPVPDATATRLAWLPRTLAAVVVLGWISSRSAAALDASTPSIWLIDVLATLTFMAVLGTALSRLRGRRPPADAKAPGAAHVADASGHASATGAVGDTDTTAVRPVWLSIVRAAGWLTLGGAGLAMLVGFIPLAMFAMNQVVWGLILLSAAYLLTLLVDDLFMSLLAPAPAAQGAEQKASDRAADAAASGVASAREQAAVLLSGLCRVLIGFLALMLLLAPYGEGPLDLFRRAGRFQEGLSIGELSLRPVMLLQGLMVMLLGFAAVRLLKAWLAKRYMPTTRMDAGMRTSATTLFGYVGMVAVVAATMSAVGVGLERVAWVASALSVGIGFGLQAVVQNFVSGLILLAERPVKVGDWVSLSGVEGDIRRINVRATEIQMGDRSTVIVPNSEFITKIVRNVTYGESLGMVQFKLPLPIATDIDRVKGLVLAAFAAHPGVLTAPGPNVQVDGVDGANLVINATGFVNSPRAAYGVKSDLLFDVLTRLRQEYLLPGQVAPIG
ncbi:DUF3772 domain-containing protein [Roseateles aquatilis]|nr:DUF3772 domain-containing protein [Roseateles aquatilis]